MTAPRHPRRASRRCDADALSERGSGAVLVLAVVGVVLSGLVAALAGSAVVVAGARAAATADSAALAAAAAAVGLVAGPPCDAAARVATANGGVLERCVVDGARAGIRVTVTVGGGGPGAVCMGADAVAGPG